MGHVNFGKLGKWADPTRNKLTAGALGPAGWFGYFAKKLLPGQRSPETNGAPPLQPDLTDLTIQGMARAEAARRGGSRRSSFLTGPLGDLTTIPVLGKSIITGG